VGITSVFDSASAWVVANISEIVDVIIGGAILSVVGYLLKQLQTRHEEPRLVIRYSQGQVREKQKMWLLEWRITNAGKATAQNVKLTLHVIDMADLKIDETLTVFENLDILNEKREMEIPVLMRMNYVEGEDAILLLPFNRGLSTPTQPTRQFPIARERSPALPASEFAYVFTLQLSGPNLREKDRVSKKYAIKFDGSKPIVVPYHPKGRRS